MEAFDLREVKRQVVGLESVQDACLRLRDHLMGLRQLRYIVKPFGERVLVVLGQADPQHVQDDLRILGVILVPTVVSASRVRASATEEINRSSIPASSRRQARAP